MASSYRYIEYTPATPRGDRKLIAAERRLKAAEGRLVNARREVAELKLGKK